MKNRFIAYYRVSTTKQGQSGLGLAAQKESVKRFLSDDKELIAEFQEVESGKKSNRPKLEEAIELAKSTNSTLIIAKLDRLSRNVKFIFTLKESGVDFICADMPDANTLTIGLLSVLAQEEAQRTSERTKAALAEIKRKIDNGEEHYSKSGNLVTKLGSVGNLKDEHRLKALDSVKEKAYNNPESKKAGNFILVLKQQGFNFSQITDKLNESGFTTPKGKSFTQIQTQRLYDRYSRQ